LIVRAAAEEYYAAIGGISLRCTHSCIPRRHSMRPFTVTLLLTIPWLALSLRACAEEPKDKTRPEERLVGTWKMVSARYGGQEFKFPEGSTHMKHITPTHFMWATYDKDGVVSRSCGGTYTLKVDAYEELVEFGLSSDFDLLKGKFQTFKCKLDGNKWHHNGKLSNGLTIEEVWERVERK
jgi:hypothetical protein